MKEWLKEFRKNHYVWYYQDDNRSEDQFITDYLRDHPLPLPTDEEITAHFTTEHKPWKENPYYKIRKDRIFGAKWMRDQIRKEEK